MTAAGWAARRAPQHRWPPVASPQGCWRVTTHFRRPPPARALGSAHAHWEWPHLLQVVELHGDLPEEEVDVAAPLHGVHEVGLCGGRGRQSEPARGTGSAGLGTTVWVVCYGAGVPRGPPGKTSRACMFFGEGRGQKLQIPCPPLPMVTSAVLSPSSLACARLYFHFRLLSHPLPEVLL